MCNLLGFADSDLRREGEMKYKTRKHLEEMVHKHFEEKLQATKVLMEERINEHIVQALSSTALIVQAPSSTAVRNIEDVGT